MVSRNSDLVGKVWTAALDLLYPPKCMVCGRLGDRIICASCRAGFERPSGARCSRCGASLRDGKCNDCLFNPATCVMRATTAGIFAGSLRDAILKVKYGPRRPLAEPLGELLAGVIRKGPFWPENFDSVVPVPLHPARERERGFNQSELLAEYVARELGLTGIDRALRRIRKTKTQTALSAARRRQNVKGAFAVCDRALIKGKILLLVDDVITTLATCDECARVLLDAGAKAVFAVALAREE